ncbi:MAG: hypothetical protein EOP11_11175 [Proteobacteria bacterium]|nr:MAG: hypothetical protein EOP11_11175 [Pseudomonadota bacterium]
MKRLLLLLLLVLALAWSFRFGAESGRRGQREGRQAIEVDGEKQNLKVATGAGAPANRAKEKLATVINDALDLRAAAPARPVIEKPAEYRGMFADAPVISSMTEYGPEPGQETAIRIVQTKMKQPYVKIREIYEERNGQRTLVDQQAMVANQLMLQRPAGVGSASFLSALRGAGAVDLKPAGDAVVATFESRPHDPKALDDYMARVREILGTEVTIEYNYIRKLI